MKTEKNLETRENLKLSHEGLVKINGLVFGKTKITLERLKTEVAAMKEVAEYPLLLCKYCGDNDYIAWSISEDRVVCVYDYKDYIQEFSVSEGEIPDIDKMQPNTKYTIIPPSKELIDELGFELYPYIWSHKMGWDNWTKRNPKKNYYTSIPREYRKLYRKCLKAINTSRSTDLGFDFLFADLEHIMYKFEQCCKIKAPAVITRSNYKQLERAYEAIRFFF